MSKSILKRCAASLAVIAALISTASLAPGTVSAKNAAGGCPTALAGVSQEGLDGLTGVVRLSQQSFTVAGQSTLAWGRTCLAAGASDLEFYAIRGTTPSSVYVIAVEQGSLELSVTEIGAGGSVVSYSSKTTTPTILGLNESITVSAGEQIAVSNAFVTLSNPSPAAQTILTTSALLAGLSETGCTSNCWLP